MGLILILLGVLAFFFIRFFYLSSFILRRIFFFRWKFSGGSSYFFNKFLFWKFEHTWIERLGGGSVYSIVFASSLY